MTALDRTHVKKTRKSHWCWGCGQCFPKGSTLVRITYAGDGIRSIYWCFICDAFYQTMDHYAQEEGIMFGDFAGEEEYLKFKQSYNHGIQSQRQVP